MATAPSAPITRMFGEISSQGSSDDNGSMPSAFQTFTYTTEKLALLDSGADFCIVCDDVLGVQLEKPQGVYFAFKDLSGPFPKI